MSFMIFVRPTVNTRKMIHKSELVKILVRATQGSAVDKNLQMYNKILLDRALISLSQGEIWLTEKGKQFLFQCQCERFLQALQEGHQPRDADEVVHWLTKHHFVVKVEQSSPTWHVTPRGRDWLSQLEKALREPHIV